MKRREKETLYLKIVIDIILYRVYRVLKCIWKQRQPRVHYVQTEIIYICKINHYEFEN